MIRTQIPQVPPARERCIDEEVGYILDLGVEFRAGQRIDSLKALLGGRLRRGVRRQRRAARARPRRPRAQGSRRQHPHRHRLAVERLLRPHRPRSASASSCWAAATRRWTAAAASRRLGGEDVKVIVRSGFEEMKASPWEKEDAMHEGIPILNFLVPKEFTHDGRPADRRDLREGRRAATTPRAGASSCPPASPTSHFACDDVLVAIGQENAFPWIERDIGIDVRRVGHAGGRQDDAAVDASRRVLRRRRRVRPEEHHLGGRPRPRGGDLDRPATAAARTSPSARRRT